MAHYDYNKTLHALWTHAVALYQEGNRNPDSYFNAEQLVGLRSCGLNVMDVYDFAEDFVKSADPDFGAFLQVSGARRDYFMTIQEGQFSKTRLDPETLPAKTDQVEGITWLPRIIPKARAKLRGELPSEIMYGCGGDRKFFKDNDIHPAEFLRAVWAGGDDDQKIIDWVKKRRKASGIA